MNLRLSLFASGCLLLAVAPVQAEETVDQQAVISVQRIWDRATHSAFTDITQFQDQLYCTFREGSGHIPGLNGTVRVIRSADGENWESVALLDERHVDLRDPKLSITPDGRLMINMGASYYHGRERQKIESRVSFSDTDGKNFGAPQKVQFPEKLVTGQDWLWRITWHGDAAYGCVQQLPVGAKRELHLLKSTDGIRYEHVSELPLEAPSETTLRFTADDTLFAMIRHGDGKAYLGQSKPPYSDWKIYPANQQFGGPNFVQLPNGAWLAGSRNFSQKPYTTSLWTMNPKSGQFGELLTLPSGGDTSYPGFVIDRENNQILVSYYSGHDGRTAIYFARLRLDVVEEKCKSLAD